MIHASYDIAESDWWRVGIDDCESVDSLEKRISRLHDTLNDAIKSSITEECDEYADFHYQKYAMKCIAAECNVKLTYRDVEKYLTFGDKELQHLMNSDRNLYRTVIKTRNVYRVVKNLFSCTFSFKGCSIEDFSLDFIKAIHREIGKEIIDNSGEFRETSAAPSGEDLYEYVKPELIQEELEKLVEECKLIYSKSQGGLLDAVKWGACFLYRFLDIHPFSNGNGRTARVTLSWILQNFTIAPLSLFTTTKRRRRIYLECLREARYDKSNKPSHLARFILESIEKEFVDWCFMMEI